jgi:acyl-CoA synthetase (AMP-forming)/AMP-acid ligase II
VEIVDGDGNPLPTGEVGRVRVRSRSIVTQMLGEDDRESEEGFRDGWYYPGDIGKFGQRGILHLLGRSADLIKRGGLMVHAQEVEEVLRRIDGIRDAAVVGVVHPELGQQVVAFLETADEIDAKALTNACRTGLAGYKVPARFVRLETLPRNAAGKVVKSRLPTLVD